MLGIVKQVFRDILSLYKKFFHWNAHKMLSHFIAILYVLLVFIFLATIYFGLAKLFGLGNVNLYRLLSEEITPDTFSAIYQIVSYRILEVVLIFAHMLLAYLYFGYIEGRKYKLLSRYYIDYKLFSRYFSLAIIYIFFAGLWFWFSLVIGKKLLGLIGITDISLVALQSSNTFSNVTLLLLITSGIFLLLFLYASYRYIFSFLYVLEGEKSIFSAIKKSFFATKTWKKLVQTTVVVLVFSIIYIPFSGFSQGISREMNGVGNHLAIEAVIANGKEITTQQQAYLDTYRLRYGELSIGDLTDLYNSLSFLKDVFNVLVFFLFTGYFTMLLVSIFKRIIIVKE